MSDRGQRAPSPPPPPVGRGSHDVLRTFFVVAWSVMVWTALWGDLSVANLVWGVVLGILTVLLVPIRHMAHRVAIRPIRMVRFVAVFAWALVSASAEVAWEIITPTSRINEGIVAVRLRTSSPGMMTLIANMVSLTPGTLTLEVDQASAMLYVHALHMGGVEEVRAAVHHFEDVALAAFGEGPTSPGPGQEET